MVKRRKLCGGSRTMYDLPPSEVPPELEDLLVSSLRTRGLILQVSIERVNARVTSVFEGNAEEVVVNFAMHINVVTRRLTITTDNNDAYEELKNIVLMNSPHIAQDDIEEDNLGIFVVR